MKKSLMSNIKHFVDSNVRHRIDRTITTNSDFIGYDLLLVERQFDDIRHICIEAEKRISALLQHLQLSPLGAYTQNVHAGLSSLSTQLAGSATNPGIKGSTNSAATNSSYPSSSGDQQPNTSSRSKSTTAQSAESAPDCANASNSCNSSSQKLSSSCDLSNQRQLELNNDIHPKFKKLPIVGFLKYLAKSCRRLRQDSPLATTFSHCSQLQTQLTNLYLNYEQTIDLECLKPIQQILEFDIPNVIKLRKLFIKSHSDFESVRAKYNGASQKRQQQQLQTGHFTSTSYTITQSNALQANTNKLDQLRNELDDVMTRFEQARDTYATELYAFVCRESELVNLFKKFYHHQADYHQQVETTIHSSLPSLTDALAKTKRKKVFGTELREHLHCSNRDISPVIQVCVHLLHSNGLDEEGLFRIPGSSLKIKRLKHAINAWFVTLASPSELDSEQCGRASLIAIHELFKEVLGQSPIHQQIVADTINNMLTASANATTAIANQNNSKEDSNSFSNSNNTLTSKHNNCNNNNMQFDLHSIAGLLKLYLRELPEHLFTYANYEDWIEATTRTTDNGERLVAYARILEQLPKENYENLKHLIRFLHLLTCHRDLNKMTAANLAITMAPSLIWSPPQLRQQPQNPFDPSQPADPSQLQTLNTNETDFDSVSLNMQMSSIGMSASLHALVIETLVNHAERLFPGEVEFTLPDFVENTPSLRVDSHTGSLVEVSGKYTPKQERRGVKSNSPTGLSTASSSSFNSSSSTNASVRSAASHGRHKRTNSMDGLESTDHDTDAMTARRNSRNRPYSVHIPQKQPVAHQRQPPPVPPAPAARSQSRQTSVESPKVTSHHSLNRQKPPAPNPLNSIKRQPYVSCKSQPNQLASKPATPSRANLSVNLAKLTGRSSPQSSITTAGNPNFTSRPSVPPPERPSRLAAPGGQQETRAAIKEHTKSEENDNRSALSISSGGHSRGDFVEIQSVDADELDVSGSGSPVASSDISGSAADSSFNDDNDEGPQSLGQSWTECVLDQGKSPELQDTAGAKAGISGQAAATKTSATAAKPTPIGGQDQQVDRAASRLFAGDESRQDNSRKPADEMDEPGEASKGVHLKLPSSTTPATPLESAHLPPKKPPRSISPKITQSTPL